MSNHRLMLIALLVGVFAFAAPAQVTFRDDFESGMKNWVLPRAADWEIAAENGNHYLHMIGVYSPGVPRRPLNYALLRNGCFSDFTLSVKLRRQKRSVLLTFGYQDTLHFNYIHLSVDTGTKQPVHNGIFRVDGGERFRIDNPDRPAALPDMQWHTVKVVRKGDSVAIYMDGSSEALLQATGKLFPYGRVGLGSFDELGDFDDFEITGTPSSGCQPLAPESGELLCGAADWKPFAPRPANAPASQSLPGPGGAGYALKLASGGKAFVYGGWRCRVEGIEPEAWYRFRARALPWNIASLRESVTVQLRWRGDFGSGVAPAYVGDFSKARQRGDAIEFDGLAQSPPRARAVDVELVLQWTRSGEVTWEALSLARASGPAPRKVKVAAVWLRPRGSKTGAESVEQFAAYAERVAAEHRPDVMVLGEMINHVGASPDLDTVAEAIPGASTERLGELARRHSTYIAFSLVERDGDNLFNTGVLLDRKGNIAGKYRKVQLPFEEVAAGVAPGDSFPVFSTDFGKVGIMICHDASFVEPARELALNGAELILVPIWGGRQPLVRARAIENGVYLATSGYDYDSEIVDPLGQVLASVPHDKGAGVAFAEIDLGKRFREDWIGDWHTTVNKQRRSAPYRYRIP